MARKEEDPVAHVIHMKPDPDPDPPDPEDIPPGEYSPIYEIHEDAKGKKPYKIHMATRPETIKNGIISPG